MAWVLGLIASDGDVVNTLKVWGITSKDYSCLEKVAKIIDYTGKIRPKYDEPDCFRLAIHSTYMVQSLLSLGIVPAKSLILEYPQIPKHLNSHFIRGYFDGDGYITTRKTRHTTGLYKGQVGLTTGSKSFANSLVGILSTEGMKASVLTKRGREVVFPNGITSQTSNTYSVKMYGYSVASFYEYIYSDSASNIRLSRKHNKFKHWYDNFGIAYGGKRLNHSHAVALRFKNIPEVNYV